MERISQDAFHARLRAQGVAREDLAFVCPMCRTVQSIRSLKSAGAGHEQAELSIGVACIGRLTKAGPATAERTPQPGRAGCDWALGGLFKLHELEVEIDGEAHPSFQVATADEAQALAAAGLAATLSQGAA